MKRIVILSFCLFCSQSLRAEWSEKARQLIENESKKYHSHNNSAFITYWGGIRRHFSDKSNKGKVNLIKLPSLLEKKIGVYFYEDKNSDRLNILFPGIFGSLEKNITKSFINTIEKMKGSVLVVPNFFSVPYIEAKPIYAERSFLVDIQVPVSIIDKYNKKSRYKYIDIYAESLGTYIGSSVLATLSNRKELKNTNFSLTLLSPPIEVNNALAHFDEKIKTSKPVFDDCSNVVNSLKTLYFFSREFFPKKLDQVYINCMESMLFHNTFVKSIEASYKVSKLYDEKMNISTFFGFLEKTRPDLYKMTKSIEKETTLSYWLKRRNLENSKIQILTSIDDFINISKDWNIFIKSIGLNKKGLIVLPWGGHSGAMAMPIWHKAFKANL